MRQIGVAIVGTGWCGGIRAQACAASPLVKSLHLAEIRPERLAEVARACGATSAVADYRELLGDDAHRGGVRVRHAGDHALPDDARRPAGRQARVPREADRARAHRGRRAHRARRRTRPEVHHRLLAALQPQVRLREEVDPRRHHRAAGERAGEPPHHAQPRQEDQRAHQALARGDGGDPRPRLRALVPRAGAAGARLLAGQLRRDARGERRRTCPTRSGSRSPWTAASPS